MWCASSVVLSGLGLRVICSFQCGVPSGLVVTPAEDEKNCWENKEKPEDQEGDIKVDFGWKLIVRAKARRKKLLLHENSIRDDNITCINI